MPAEDAETERSVAFGEAVRTVKEGDFRAFFDEFAHDGVQELGEQFGRVGVFPFIEVEQVHRGEAADKAFFVARRQHDFGAEVGGVHGHVAVFVDVRAAGIGVVFEEEVGDAGFGFAL